MIEGHLENRRGVWVINTDDDNVFVTIIEPNCKYQINSSVYS